MKIRMTLLTASLLLAGQAMAKDVPVTVARDIANTTTPASVSQPFDELEARSLAALRESLKAGGSSIDRAHLEKAAQSNTQADSAWLKASGYNFNVKENQKAGIELLSGFSNLPAPLLDQNLKTVESINLNATQGLRHQALADAEGISYLYFLSDALGPRLGKAFIAAYDKGELNKAAALIKATEISTGEAKKHFNYKRPFLIAGNTIHQVPDDVVVKDNKPYAADGGSFPSGHTNTGYTDSLLMAEMLPERFDSLVERGARYGYSRIVLGVHYPLDVMGSRMVAQRNVAHYLNDPAYRKLFNEARDELRTALEKECGASLAECAKTVGKDDPYRDPAMREFYRFTMTYDLPAQKGKAQAVKVPEGAEVLLEAALPNLSAAARRDLMVKTALPGGYPLSGETADQNFWQRLNLPAAYAMAHKAK
jgi:membrane-associated phospholipid phosphatase